MAGSTGLEPAASAVTGQRSNQLNYDPKTETPVHLRACHFENALRWTRLRSETIAAYTPKLAAASEGVGGTGFEPVTAGV